MAIIASFLMGAKVYCISLMELLGRGNAAFPPIAFSAFSAMRCISFGDYFLLQQCLFSFGSLAHWRMFCR